MVPEIGPKSFGAFEKREYYENSSPVIPRTGQNTRYKIKDFLVVK